jgi:hypothetical protein
MLPNRILLYNRIYFNDLCIYVTGVYWNPRNALLLFPDYPWSYCGGNPLEWLCSVTQDHSRSRVAGSTHKISGLCSSLDRVVGYKVDENLNPRSGRAIRGKWRILDGKDESGLRSDSELQGGSPHLCRLRTASVGPCGTRFDYVLTHRTFYGVQ